MKPHLALALAAALSLPPLAAEVDGEIPFGIEAVTGVRSGYVYRGFDLAGPLFDFQVEAEVTLRDDLFLNAGGWFATEISDDFTEGAAFLDLRYEFHSRFLCGAAVAYHGFDHSFFENGFDLGAYLTWLAGPEWDVTVGAYRDFGAEAWYAKAETGWSHRLTDDAFFSVSGGVSLVEDYYGRSGLNDLYGRTSLTYNLTSTISLTPFVGWSLELNDDDGHELLGGLWFEVSF